MPHVTMHFDPKQVNQGVIDRLKKILQQATAEALSSPMTYLVKDDPEHEDITTLSKEIFVRQQACHETDVNASPIEIVVEAGRSKGRSGDKVAALLEDKVLTAQEGWDPKDFPKGDDNCIWVKFCEENGFRVIEL